MLSILYCRSIKISYDLYFEYFPICIIAFIVCFTILLITVGIGKSEDNAFVGEMKTTRLWKINTIINRIEYGIDIVAVIFVGLKWLKLI